MDKIPVYKNFLFICLLDALFHRIVQFFRAYADSYLKDLEAGEESDNGYHEFLQGMADREIISLYENYGIVTNIKIEGWEPASR